VPVPEHRTQLIEKLTGVYTSKHSYYAELKDKITELSKRNFQLEIISELAQEFNISLPEDYLDKTVKKIYERVQEIFYVKRIAILTLEGQKLQVSHCYPCDEICGKGIKISGEEGKQLWKAVSDHRQIAWKRDAGSPDGFLELQGLDVALINPLITQNKIYGLFVVGSDRPTAYDPMDMTFLQQLANQIAIYFQDGALFAEVNRAKSEWEATFKAVRDIIVMIDPDLRILRVNQAAVEFCGLPEPEITGRKYCDTFCTVSDIQCSSCVFYEALQTGDTINVQRRLNDGRILEMYGYPVPQENREMGIVVYLRDITERLKMQVQLLQTARLAALGEMAAGVAHELNTPLAVIIGDAQLLLRSTPQDDQRYSIFEDIKTCGLRCKRIVRGLLTFSRQEQYVFQPLCLNDVVREALKLVEYHIETDNIKIRQELDAQLPAMNGNSQQLEQVVVNLLLNARQSFDHENDSEPMITVKTGYDEERNQVFIRVSDSGQGIPQEILTKIFDPFFTSKGVNKGTGLGLSVSLGIVQKHGGTIAVESEPGKGAAFTVYLPPSHGSDDVQEENDTI
jgi:two-component system NtrC family sensor kinase